MKRVGKQIYLDKGDWCDITSIPPEKRREIFPQIPSWFSANSSKYCILWGLGKEDSTEVDSYNSSSDFRKDWIEEVKGTFGATKDITACITIDLGDW